MNSTRILTIVGARPQFIKAAAVSRAVAAHNAAGRAPALCESIIHTGQHYDANMSQVFFDDLRIPAPAHHLGVGGGGHGEQTGLMLQRLEPVLLAEKPDRVLLYGDTNSTLAGALVAAKLHIPIAHVEAGLRSFNRRMPEEINRIVADRLSDLLFCPTDTALRNLADEGIRTGVHQVGDVMFDSVLFHAARAAASAKLLGELELSPKSYYLATVHRAENTDDPARLQAIFDAFARLERPVLLPLHPRTRKSLAALPGAARGDAGAPRNVRLIDPQPYLETLILQKNARVVLTDSGGVQKEAYFCGTPCVTLRDETEWVELVEIGANRLAGADSATILAAVRQAESAAPIDTASRPLYGDGRSAEKIVTLLGSSD